MSRAMLIRYMVATIVLIPLAVLATVDRASHLTTNDMGIFLMHPWLYLGGVALGFAVLTIKRPER